MLTLILGGAAAANRVGAKFGGTSRANHLCSNARAGTDHEMAARIEHHRAGRPAAWQTIEEPVALADSRSKRRGQRRRRFWWIALPSGSVIFFGSIATRVQSRRNHRANPDRTDCQKFVPKPVFLVSNELGSGTVPEAALTRAFRDAQGFLNQQTAELSDEVILTVAGLPLYLKKAAI